MDPLISSGTQTLPLEHSTSMALFRNDSGLFSLSSSLLERRAIPNYMIKMRSIAISEREISIIAAEPSKKTIGMTNIRRK